MNFLILTLIFLIATGCVNAQSFKIGDPTKPPIDTPLGQSPIKSSQPEGNDQDTDKDQDQNAISHFDELKAAANSKVRNEPELQPLAHDADLLNDLDDPKLTGSRFHWKPAVAQSMIFLGIQHGARMSQAKTRHGLGGPFFKDWKDSVSTLGSWGDGGLFFTNYIAHPLQGGVTGRIFVNNSDKAKKQEFGVSKEYWKSRMKAMAWSTFWSTQFELGPLSEASIGNVGMRPTDEYGKNGWNDLVVTPVIGTGVVVAEDAIERYVLKNWLERKLTSRTRIKVWRTILTPTTSFSNILRGKMPWKRDDRN